jgi:hypothetical protein
MQKMFLMLIFWCWCTDKLVWRAVQWRGVMWRAVTMWIFWRHVNSYDLFHLKCTSEYDAARLVTPCHILSRHIMEMFETAIFRITKFKARHSTSRHIADRHATRMHIHDSSHIMRRQKISIVTSVLQHIFFTVIRNSKLVAARRIFVSRSSTKFVLLLRSRSTNETLWGLYHLYAYADKVGGAIGWSSPSLLMTNITWVVSLQSPLFPTKIQLWPALLFSWISLILYGGNYVIDRKSLAPTAFIVFILPSPPLRGMHTSLNHQFIIM